MASILYNGNIMLVHPQFCIGNNRRCKFRKILLFIIKVDPCNKIDGFIILILIRFSTKTHPF